MVGPKNRNHHRDYSFRVVEITSAHKLQSNIRLSFLRNAASYRSRPRLRSNPTVGVPSNLWLGITTTFPATPLATAPTRFAVG